MTAHEVIDQYLEDAHAVHPAHLTASGLLARLDDAGYTVVDTERYRVARKAFTDLTEAWAELRLDTDKDQALHDRLVAASRHGARLLDEGK